MNLIRTLTQHTWQNWNYRGIKHDSNFTHTMGRFGNRTDLPQQTESRRQVENPRCKYGLQPSYDTVGYEQDRTCRTILRHDAR